MVVNIIGPDLKDIYLWRYDMVKNIFKLLIIELFVVSLGLSAGCESDAQTGTLLGGAAGAGIGALAGGSTEATLIGGAIGGAVGYGLGNEGDKKKTRAEINQLRAERQVETIWITNSNGSQTPIRLRRDGPGYVGPRGEYYSRRPSEQDMAKIYGM